MTERPHSMWKARAKNRNGTFPKGQTMLQILEDDLRFSVNHPYFRVSDLEKLERIKRLDILSDLIEMTRKELRRK